MKTERVQGEATGPTCKAISDEPDFDSVMKESRNFEEEQKKAKDPAKSGAVEQSSVPAPKSEKAIMDAIVTNMCMNNMVKKIKEEQKKSKELMNSD